jgi:hypothetical protein
MNSYLVLSKAAFAVLDSCSVYGGWLSVMQYQDHQFPHEDSYVKGFFQEHQSLNIYRHSQAKQPARNK